MINSLIFLPANFTISANFDRKVDNGHIAALASMRLNFLSQEMQVANGGWGFPFLQLFLVIRILSPHIRHGITWAAQRAPDQVTNSIAEWIDQKFTSCEDTMDYVVNYIDPLLMAITTVTYIALLALGHVTVAAIGLASIALIALYRFDCLPTPVVQVLEPLGLLSMLTISIITPAPLIIRILCVAVSALDCVDYVWGFFESSENEA